jgi:hypothetical protein
MVSQRSCNLRRNSAAFMLTQMDAPFTGAKVLEGVKDYAFESN